MTETTQQSFVIVETKHGKGKIKTPYEDHLIEGKLQVYLDNGQKMLCNPKNIKIIGYIN